MKKRWKTTGTLATASSAKRIVASISSVIRGMFQSTLQTQAESLDSVTIRQGISVPVARCFSKSLRSLEPPG